MKFNNKFLIYLLYYSIFFPFVSIVPLDTDLQPVFVVCTILIILNKKITFYKKDMLFIFFAIISLLYFNYSKQDLIPFKGYGAYFSIFISIFFLLVYEKVFNFDIFISVLIRSIQIYFCSSILFYLFPNEFSIFFFFFFRAINALDTLYLFY